MPSSLSRVDFHKVRIDSLEGGAQLHQDICPINPSRTLRHGKLIARSGHIGEATWISPSRKLRRRSGAWTLQERCAWFDTEPASSPSRHGTSALLKAAGFGRHRRLSLLSVGSRPVPDFRRKRSSARRCLIRLDRADRSRHRRPWETPTGRRSRAGGRVGRRSHSYIWGWPEGCQDSAREPAREPARSRGCYIQRRRPYRSCAVHAP